MNISVRPGQVFFRRQRDTDGRVKGSPNIKGDAAVKAVQDQLRDVRVKSLVAFQ
jgi:hypothetical protein